MLRNATVTNIPTNVVTIVAASSAAKITINTVSAAAMNVVMIRTEMMELIDLILVAIMFVSILHENR